MKKTRLSSKSISTLTAILLVFSAVSAVAETSAMYSDCDLTVVSDNHLMISWQPDFSDDLTETARLSVYPLGKQELRARVLLVAIPAGGDLSITSTFARIGSIEPDKKSSYITANMPMVITGPVFEARGHRFGRIVIFPYRLEDGRLAVYGNFEIDVRVNASTYPFAPMLRASRIDTVLAGTVINADQFYRFGTSSSLRAAKKPVATPFDDGGEWYKIAVMKNGVTKITGSALAQAGVDLNGLLSDSLRFFYAGGKNPPDSLNLPEPELSEIAIQVVDGGDGFFGSDDYLLFYAESPNRFDYDTGEPVYVKNSYSDRNYYWLSIGGHNASAPQRWTLSNGMPTTPDRVVVDVRYPVRFEQDNIIKEDGDGRIRNYFEWFWNDAASQTISVPLTDCVSGDSIEIILSGVVSYTAASIALNGVPMMKGVMDSRRIRFWDVSGAAVSGINTLDIDMYHLSGQYLDYLDINYSRRLRVGGDQLEFTSQNYAGILEYHIENYTTSCYALDISDPDFPALVDGVEISGTTAAFQGTASSIDLARYIVYSSTALPSPLSIQHEQPADLRANVDQYDCLVVSPRRFQTALGDYVDYRQSTAGYRVKLVAVEDIYDLFGYGLPSPMAIRDYFRYAYQNYDDPAPFAALLVGDGTYDFLDNLGNHTPSYIPPFIWGVDFSAGDDNYVYFGRFSWLDSDSSYVPQADRGWDMMIARWPVRSSSEVAAQIAAIKQFESPEAQGSWRNRITFVADDEFKSGYDTEIIHTAQAETLSVYHTPAAYVHQKIYLTDYPFASNGEKPEVNDAIVKAINDGTLIVNYIGHGSPDVWSDEHVLKKSIDLSRMHNTDRPTIVIAGSCSIGFFDDPAKEGMAEIMFRQPGGAIETVSATRLVYATDNAIFNYDLYDFFFLNKVNMCEAVYAAKMKHQYDYNYSLIRNDQSYILMGDPLARVGLPEYTVEFDIGADSILTPLEYFSFSGRVLDAENSPVAANGLLEVNVYDSRIIRHHRLGIDYSLEGPTLFRGLVDVSAGMFDGGFMVPLDIDYGGTAAHLSGYGQFGGVSGIGGVDSLAIAMTPVATTDNTGPSIEVSVDGNPDFISGNRIHANATLILTISDESGINLTGGLGHRIEIIIDDDNNSTINLTDRFTYTSGSYQTGELRFALPDLSPDRHSFKVRAWDNANNPAELEFEAILSDQGRIAINNVMNYPNPMEESTEFFFDLSESAEWVELRIFTLAGREIKSFRSDNLPVGSNRRFLWDGRDFDGDRVAEGIYLYKITAHGMGIGGESSASATTETFGKLIMLN